MTSQTSQKEYRDEFKTMQVFSKLKPSYLIYFAVLKTSTNLDFLYILKNRIAPGA